MADKPKPIPKPASGLTRAGELYVQGDKLPVPDVEEKNTDSVWALWSDLSEEKPQLPTPGEPANDRERDFLETVPMRLHELADEIAPDPARKRDK